MGGEENKREREPRGTSLLYALGALSILFQPMLVATLVLLLFCECKSEGLDKLATVKELLSETAGIGARI